MDPDQILRIVDSLHRDKNIDTEVVFRAIESAFASAARRQYGDTSDVLVTVDRDNGSLSATLDGEPLDPAEMIGRIGAQMAKQVIIQKISDKLSLTRTTNMCCVCERYFEAAWARYNTRCAFLLASCSALECILGNHII